MGSSAGKFWGMLVLLACLGVCVRFDAAAKNKKTLDEEIAEFSIAVGRNRLARRPADPSGLVLLRLGGAILPLNEDYLLVVGKLEREIKLKPERVRVTEQKLLSVMLSRAEKLLDLPNRNIEINRLALLYLLTLEHFFPKQDRVILGLQKLKAVGVGGELDAVLNRPIDLDVVYGRKKPPKAPGAVKKTTEPAGDPMALNLTIPVDEGFKTLKRHFDIKGKPEYWEKERKKAGRSWTVRAMNFQQELKLTSRFTCVGNLSLRTNANFDKLTIELWEQQLSVRADQLTGKKNRFSVVRRNDELLIVNPDETVIVQRQIPAGLRRQPTRVELTFQSKRGHFRSISVRGSLILPTE